ncbi:MAG: hypothetical protein HQ568_02820 [Calditrichaeota bacterium]|nr:hypothetical protein [Calditrichota bacterium]
MNTILKIIFITISSLILIMFLTSQPVLAQDIEPTAEDTEVVSDETTDQENEGISDEEIEANADSTGGEADSTGGETVIEDIQPLDDDVLLDAEEADIKWRTWMETDDLGERPYWFRRSFEIIDPPASGRLFITCDDNYSLYVNGEYIAADETDEIDWMDVQEWNISDWLVLGNNIIAIEAIDVDASRQGLVVAIEYSTVPDIDTQLDRMVERELDKQEIARSEKSKRESAKAALRKSQLRPPTEQELQDMRTQEKNKLE